MTHQHKTIVPKDSCDLTDEDFCPYVHSVPSVQSPLEFKDLPEEFQQVLRFIKNNKILVYLEAIISGGKSSLCKSVNRVLTKYEVHNEWYPEPINNKLLDLFYSDPPKYAFDFQSIVIRDRVHTNEDAIKFLKKNKGLAIIDRSRFGDCAFGIMHHTNKNISDVEFAVYTDLIKSKRLDKYNSLLGLEPDKIKDFVVYLICTPEKARERVIKRGNVTEIQGCTIEYLSELEHNYSKVLHKNGLDTLEQAVIDEVYKNYNNKVLFIDYNTDLQIDTDGFIAEHQVFEILTQIMKKIAAEGTQHLFS